MVLLKRKVKVSQIRWQCRRGMLELDMLLHQFYDAHYSHLSETEKTLFSRLLSYSDHELYHLLMGTQEPAEIQLRPLICLIKQEKS